MTIKALARLKSYPETAGDVNDAARAIQEVFKKCGLDISVKANRPKDASVSGGFVFCNGKIGKRTFGFAIDLRIDGKKSELVLDWFDTAGVDFDPSWSKNYWSTPQDTKQIQDLTYSLDKTKELVTQNLNDLSNFWKRLHKALLLIRNMAEKHGGQADW